MIIRRTKHRSNPGRLLALLLLGFTAFSLAAAMYPAIWLQAPFQNMTPPIYMGISLLLSHS